MRFIVLLFILMPLLGCLSDTYVWEFQAVTDVPDYSVTLNTQFKVIGQDGAMSGRLHWSKITVTLPATDDRPVRTYSFDSDQITILPRAPGRRYHRVYTSLEDPEVKLAAAIDVKRTLMGDVEIEGQARLTTRAAGPGCCEDTSPAFEYLEIFVKTIQSLE